MNDDYLWDRTGEPDPEIQHLEQILGSLRYQPRPLELPEQVRIGRSRTFFPRIAIAAAVATMLVGGGSWLILHKPNVPVGRLESALDPPAVEKVKTAPEKDAPPAENEVVAESNVVKGAVEIKSKRSGVRKSVMAGNKQFRTLRPRGTELTARDRAEAESAKEQLLLALRVASAKLSLAQKKAQGSYPGSLIRNQHKIG